MTIELAPHQRLAVDDALSLPDRYGGVLLADDVGLGKSYVAAAVGRAMQRRGAAIEVIVPAPRIVCSIGDGNSDLQFGGGSSIPGFDPRRR